MVKSVSRDVLVKVRKLALLPEELRQSRWAIPETRLTTLKGLCHEPEMANRFVTYLARKTLDRVQQGKGRSRIEKDLTHRQMMADPLVVMEAWLKKQSEKRRQRLRELLAFIRAEQNEYEKIKWGSVRLITDPELLLFECALNCLVGMEQEVGSWAYQTARHYAERCSSSEGAGLTSSSVELVQDIADFWLQEYGLDQKAHTLLATPMKAKEEKPTTRARKGLKGKRKKVPFTPRQGQFLAFIHLYRKLHGQGPAELDMMKYFCVTPPAVHAMVVRLEQLGLITREPGVPRSSRVVMPEEMIPPLDGAHGTPW